jgi:membrane protein implicated in regulation of membrane protease activity
MTWADFYLFSFLAGFFFSVVSVVAGQLDFNFGAHTDTGDAFHVDLDGGADANTHHGASPFNLGTIAAFLAWFGGTGYLITQYSRLWFAITLFIATTGGVAGAAIVFWFLSRVLMREREELDPADYDLVGVLGTVSSTIRAGGVGEILFSQQGLRRAVPARSDGAEAIPTGTEVVVTVYSDGIASVRPWQELTREASATTH